MNGKPTARGSSNAWLRKDVLSPFRMRTCPLVRWAQVPKLNGHAWFRGALISVERSGFAALRAERLCLSGVWD